MKPINIETAPFGRAPILPTPTIAKLSPSQASPNFLKIALVASSTLAISTILYKTFRNRRIKPKANPPINLLKTETHLVDSKSESLRKTPPTTVTKTNTSLEDDLVKSTHSLDQEPQRTLYVESTDPRTKPTTLGKRSTDLPASKYKPIKNPADGNCLFHSIVDSLGEKILDELIQSSEKIKDKKAFIEMQRSFLVNILRLNTVKYIQENQADPKMVELLTQEASEVLSDKIELYTNAISKLTTNEPILSFAGSLTSLLSFHNSDILSNLAKTESLFDFPNQKNELLGLLYQFIYADFPKPENLTKSIEEQRPTLLKMLQSIKEKLELALGKAYELLLTPDVSTSKIYLNENLLNPYLSHLEKNGSYGGAACVYALSQLYNLNIQTYSLSLEDKLTYNRIAQFGTPESTQVLLKYQTNHYEALSINES